MATVDVLSARLTLDVTGFANSLQSAASAAQRFAAQINQALRGISGPKAIKFDGVAKGLREASLGARELAESLDRPLMGAKNKLEAVAKTVERVGKVAEGGVGLSKWAAQIVEHSTRAERTLANVGVSADKVAERLRKMGESLEWLKTAGDSATPLLEAFQNLGPVADRLKKGMQAAGRTVRSGAGRAGKAVRSGFASIADGVAALKPVFSRIGSALAHPLDTIRNGLRGIGPAFNSLKAVFAAVGTALLNPLTAIEGAVSALGAVFAAFGSAATVAISPVALAVAGIAAAAYLVYRNWASVKATLSKIWESISSQAQQAWGAIQPPIEAVWKAAKKLAEFLWDMLVVAVGKVGDALQEVATVIVDAVTPAFQAMYGEGGLLSTVVKGVWEILKSLWEVIRSLALTIWQVLKPPLTWFWELLKDLFSVLGSVLRAAWDVVKVILRWAGVLAGSVVISLQNTVRWVLFLVEALLKLVRLDFKGIADRFKEVAAESQKDAERMSALWSSKAKDAADATVQAESEAAEQRLEIEEQLQAKRSKVAHDATWVQAPVTGANAPMGDVTSNSGAAACDCSDSVSNDCLQRICDSLGDRFSMNSDRSVFGKTQLQRESRTLPTSQEYHESAVVEDPTKAANGSEATPVDAASRLQIELEKAISPILGTGGKSDLKQANKRIIEGMGKMRAHRQREMAGLRDTVAGKFGAQRRGASQDVQAIGQHYLASERLLAQAMKAEGEQRRKLLMQAAKESAAAEAMNRAYKDGVRGIKGLTDAAAKAGVDLSKLDEAEQAKLAHAQGQLSPQEQEAQQQFQQFQQQVQQQMQQAAQQAAQQMGQQAWDSGQAMLQQAMEGPAQVEQMIREAAAAGDMKAAVELIRGRLLAQLKQSKINLHNLASDPLAGGGFGSAHGGVSNEAYFMTLDIPLVRLIKFLQAQLAHLPKLAAGGVATRPTTALIGEAGPEAVVPLTSFANMLGGLPVFGKMQATMERMGDWFNGAGNRVMADKYFANLTRIQNTFDYVADTLWNSRRINLSPVGAYHSPAVSGAAGGSIGMEGGTVVHGGQTFNLHLPNITHHSQADALLDAVEAAARRRGKPAFSAGSRGVGFAR